MGQYVGAYAVDRDSSLIVSCKSLFLLGHLKHNSLCVEVDRLFCATPSPILRLVLCFYLLMPRSNFCARFVAYLYLSPLWGVLFCTLAVPDPPPSDYHTSAAA